VIEVATFRLQVALAGQIVQAACRSPIRHASRERSFITTTPLARRRRTRSAVTSRSTSRLRTSDLLDYRTSSAASEESAAGIVRSIGDPYVCLTEDTSANPNRSRKSLARLIHYSRLRCLQFDSRHRKKSPELSLPRLIEE